MPDDASDQTTDFFAEGDALAADMAVLNAMRVARKRLSDALIGASTDQSDDFLARLRQEAVFQMAELFYLVKACGINMEDDIRGLAHSHNEHMARLLDDDKKRARLGLTEDRVRWAQFGDLGAEKLVENFTLKHAFDQSDLARLLVELMSQESCRQVVATLGRAGLLERIRSPYRAILVRSPGTLETLFAGYLRDVRARMTERGRSAP